jgi:hypothetical protein
MPEPVRLDGPHTGDLGDLLLENPLNTIRKRQLRHRTAPAGSLKRNLDHSVITHVHELDVAPVGLQRGTDLIEYCLNLIPVHAILLVSGQRAPAT